MGRKVHPMGFRIGVIRDWQAKWYADKHYVEFLQEDLKLRQAIRSGYGEAGISLVEIDRQANKVMVNIYTARPGVVIGRGGQRVDEMRQHLENLVGKRIQLNIQEIRQPELDAYLVARSVAEQIERRVAYRRVMKQAIFRTIQAGAKGMRINCAGRLAGAEIARREMTHEGQVPLHTLRADIDYGFTEARTTLGRIGVKVWIYKGDILPEPKAVEVEETPAEAEVKPVEAEAEAVKAEVEPVEVEAEAAQAEVEAVEAEVKPAEVKVKPAEVEAEAAKAEVEAVEAEVKPAEVKVKPAEVEAEAVKAEVKPVKAEVKPTKPKTKRTKSAASKSAKAEPSTSVGKEEKDGTTQAGEIPQDS